MYNGRQLCTKDKSIDVELSAELQENSSDDHDILQRLHPELWSIEVGNRKMRIYKVTDGAAK